MDRTALQLGRGSSIVGELWLDRDLSKIAERLIFSLAG
jgi:hypothetical protein